MTLPTNKESEIPQNVPRPTAIRWWPAVIILLAAAGAVIWIWLNYGRQRQDKNVAIFMVGFFTFALLLLWAIFLSRMRWKFRAAVLGTLVGLMLLAKILVRVHGVTGDF